VALQIESITRDIDQQAEELKEVARGGKISDVEMNVQLQKMQALMRQLEERDAAMLVTQQKVVQERDRWSKAVANLDHLTMPVSDLLKLRGDMRSRLAQQADALMNTKPRDWHISVVIGPAGRGKSSFICDVLSSAGYPGRGVSPAAFISCCDRGVERGAPLISQ
jgi:acetyl-CoA carboxylase alpha subunit